MLLRVSRLWQRLWAALALGALLGGLAGGVPATRAAEEFCFAQSKYCISPLFDDRWTRSGGLAQFGYPIGPYHTEVLEDGREYAVQYFERARFEYHPEFAAPYDVQLGQFGRRVLSDAYGALRDYRGYQQATARAERTAKAGRYFEETGHNLDGRFLAYWEKNGGLAQFGYPITEERWDSLTIPSGAACCATQYFERARFEYHPENAGTPYEVQLGQFGRQVLAENALLSGDFSRRYLGNTTLRERLGAPTSPVIQTQGASQPFQRGLMFWRADQRRIYVLNGTPTAGLVMQEFFSRDYFNDYWEEGQPVGGGPAPTEPNTYLPWRGFYKVWREHGEVRETIGYALTPEERGYPMQVQEFAAGLLLTADMPNGRFVYALYTQRASNSTVLINYERLT